MSLPLHGIVVNTRTHRDLLVSFDLGKIATFFLKNDLCNGNVTLFLEVSIEL